jgi:hypothetical protein
METTNWVITEQSQYHYIQKKSFGTRMVLLFDFSRDMWYFRFSKFLPNLSIEFNFGNVVHVPAY